MSVFICLVITRFNETDQMEKSKVKLIIVISGKRKSGKDYIADNIVKNFGIDKCIIIRLAVPIKSHFAKKYGLDFQKMLTASSYKEEIRQEMVEWGEEQRKLNLHVFCKMITDEAVESNKPIWIVSDCRRISDIEYFKKFALDENMCVKFVRVNSDISTRGHRGWEYTKGIDDAATECQLDAYSNWDVVMRNSAGDDLDFDIRNFCEGLCIPNLLSK